MEQIQHLRSSTWEAIGKSEAYERRKVECPTSWRKLDIVYSTGMYSKPFGAMHGKHGYLKDLVVGFQAMESAA